MSQEQTPTGRISGVLFNVTPAGPAPVKAKTVALVGDAVGGRVGVTTNASGVFSFNNLPDGDYLVRQDELPEGVRVVNEAANADGYLAVKIQDGQAVELEIGHDVAGKTETPAPTPPAPAAE